MRLKGKRIVVTGAASGIGRATTLLFLSEGAEVFAIDKDETGLKSLAEPSQRPIQTYIADCGDETEIETAFKAAAEEKRLDAVFANAGRTLGNVPFLEQTGQHWDEILRTNLLGAFYSIKHGARQMMRHGYGSIICTASIAGLRANAAGAPYSASKAGVISLVQTAANALADSRERHLPRTNRNLDDTKPVRSGTRARKRE
jgi:NAD(P)-dependent dehydrogenase (short-subunit alcohol dehydrogenase family)